MQPQCTIAKTVGLSGRGLHTGQKVTVWFEPAALNTGYIFKLNSLASQPKIKASLNNISEIIRSTNLGKSQAEVKSVEHVLAALYGLGIDNIEISLTGGNELPALDGSALPWVKILGQAGKKIQKAPKNFIAPSEPFWLSEDDKLLIALPSTEFKTTYFVDYPHHLVGAQMASFTITNDTFQNEIAPARTFGFADEEEWLKSQNLALSASPENVIIIYENSFSSPLRFPDEMVRHKMLDLIGDLSLVCASIKAHIIAVKSNHALNIKLARKIAKSGMRCDET